MRQRLGSDSAKENADSNAMITMVVEPSADAAPAADTATANERDAAPADDDDNEEEEEEMEEGGRPESEEFETVETTETEDGVALALAAVCAGLGPGHIFTMLSACELDPRCVTPLEIFAFTQDMQRADTDSLLIMPTPDDDLVDMLEDLCGKGTKIKAEAAKMLLYMQHNVFITKYSGGFTISDLIAVNNGRLRSYDGICEVTTRTSGDFFPDAKLCPLLVGLLKHANGFMNPR